jgi:uncharacterized glyoxalase superfamily protein PhnB
VLFPGDLDQTVDFYTVVLGFAVERDERDAAAAYVALRPGDVRVGAARRPPRGGAERRPPTGVELVPEVDDLLKAHARVLASGWPVKEDITARPWRLSDYRVLDPSGYYWRLTEHESNATPASTTIGAGRP